MEQWLILRGYDVNKPVLLFLSGGPGASEAARVLRFNAELEKHFVVVIWEQRGCGKSYPSINPKADLTVYQYQSFEAPNIKDPEYRRDGDILMLMLKQPEYGWLDRLYYLLGLHSLPVNVSAWAILGGFLTSFVLTILPGFGEEFGWRAYLLPRLAQSHSLRKALLIHAFIWWAWHIPALVKIGSQVEGADDNLWLSVAVTMVISLLPAMMNAILFAYVWMTSQSLAVASVYHSAYDEVRDALERGIGFGPLVSIWQMAVTLIFGAILLWKADWTPLRPQQKGNWQ